MCLTSHLSFRVFSKTTDFFHIISESFWKEIMCKRWWGQWWCWWCPGQKCAGFRIILAAFLLLNFNSYFNSVSFQCSDISLWGPQGQRLSLFFSLICCFHSFGSCCDCKWDYRLHKLDLTVYWCSLSGSHTVEDWCLVWAALSRWEG